MEKAERIRKADEAAKQFEKVAQPAPLTSRPPPHLSSFSFDFVVSFIVITGSLTILISLAIMVTGIIFAIKAEDRWFLMMPTIAGGIAGAISGMWAIALAHCMKLLQSIERNTSRIT